MEFRQKIEKFAGKIPYLKSAIDDEESTKHSLILPFLTFLEYDVYDPREVKPEYVADFAKNKKKEKVDYCVSKNGLPIFFLEAKPAGEELDLHDGQLSRYFNATPGVRIAILSNGLRYNFYTDIYQKNIMDDDPFYSFEVENMADADYDFVGLFARSAFDAEVVVECARKLARNKSVFSALNSRTVGVNRNPGRPKRLDAQKMTVTIDKRLLKIFDEFAWQNMLNKSEIVRDLIARYLRDSGISV